MKKANETGLIEHNPASTVLTSTGHARLKDTLTENEIGRLFASWKEDGQEVKRAALFSYSTGMRWVDFKALKWEQIDLPNGRMKIFQQKTGREISVSLNATELEVLPKEQSPKSFVFDLPTANGANKSLIAWVKKEGIRKKISWHCLRHSFGTNLIRGGADVNTVRDLLGHTTLKHTQRYLEATNDLKQKATDRIIINLNG